MVPRSYDINRNMYSSSMKGCTEENDYYYKNENSVDNSWEGKTERKDCPWENNCGYYVEDQCDEKNDCGCYYEDEEECNDGFECIEEGRLLAFNEVQSTELVTIKSAKPRVLTIKNTSCEACIDEVKLISTRYPDGSQKDKCIIQGSLIFTICYYAECRGYNKSEVKFLIPFSDYLILPIGSKFDGNVKLDVEDAYAKSIDGTNLILSATILSSAYGGR